MYVVYNITSIISGQLIFSTVCMHTVYIICVMNRKQTNLETSRRLDKSKNYLFNALRSVHLNTWNRPRSEEKLTIPTAITVHEKIGRGARTRQRFISRKVRSRG